MRFVITFTLKLLLLLLVVLALVAPFTFLKPKSSGFSHKSYHSVKLPNFHNMKDIELKKNSFFNFLKPAITKVNQSITQDRAILLAIRNTLIANDELSPPMIRFISLQQQRYNLTAKGSYLTQVIDLLTHVDVIPPALILVQAANESAWGTSRFAREGLNFFGLWCYDKGCGMVPNARNANATHEVKIFSSVENAVEGYINNINRHKAYQQLRKIRADLRISQQTISAEALADGLLAYSERGQAYVTDIKIMLRQNAKYLN